MNPNYEEAYAHLHYFVCEFLDFLSNPLNAGVRLKDFPGYIQLMKNRVRAIEKYYIFSEEGEG